MEQQVVPAANKNKSSSSSRFRRVCVFCGSSPGKKPAYQLAAVQLGRHLVRTPPPPPPPLNFWVGWLVWFVHSAARKDSCCPAAKGRKTRQGKRGIQKRPNRSQIPMEWIVGGALLLLRDTCVHDQSINQSFSVERGIDLVYGGGSVGLMGLVSRAVHNGGGHVLGIVPNAVLPRELIGDTPGELKDVSGMHQRKAEMARNSDAFVALPGGYGTLEELLEVITWAQLGIHSKPVGLLNVDGYYDSLLSFVDKAVEEGFVTPAARHIVVAARTPHDLLAKLEDYVPVHDAASPNLTWETMEQIKSSDTKNTSCFSR